MRDDRFKAAHRGGSLDLHGHHLLATWAADCAEHVLPLFSEQHPQDDRPRRAIETARAWVRGQVTVGEARAASLEAHAAARNATDAAARAAARSAGQAVGTAHMADHAPHAAAYAVQAVRAAGIGRDDLTAADRERTWQEERLPGEIRALVLSAGERGSASD
jgi:hypothetical protein